jgi:hypothetical protein
MKPGTLLVTKFLIVFALFFEISGVQSQIVKAVNDTVDLYPEIPVTFNLLANDTIALSDSISVNCGLGNSGLINITYHYLGFFTFVYVPMWGFNGMTNGQYTILDYTAGLTSSARIIFRIHDHSFDSLDINNIFAVFNAYGNHFSRSGSATHGFFAPSGSGKSTIYCNALWIGGKGDDSTLYLAAERYLQGSSFNVGKNPDFYAGPVMDSVNYSIYQDTLWNTVWKIRKSDIEYHKSHWNTSGYITPPAIRTWPGNGNTNYGQARMLAPFFDRNGDQNYDPSDGDYPLTRGDVALFFIYNDDRDIHKETGGNKLKVEIHGMAYAYDMPGDSAFKNTIFLNYTLFNRSQRTYYNTYLGLFTDFDLGNFLDDYNGSDVGRNSYFVYNGEPVDGSGLPNEYGAHPPAQALTILGGPFLDPADKDRPRFDISGHPLCNESVNGTGFGDSIVNNERYGLTGFINYPGGTDDFTPVYASGYYNCMKSIWKDSSNLVYGGDGHISGGGYGPSCRFMDPGDSDTLNWGTGCHLPNGPVNWTERTAKIVPGDRRSVGSMGPFTFRPGDVQQLDYAFIFARDYTGQDSLYPSLGKLRQMIDIVRNSYNTGILPNGNPFFGINAHPSKSEFSVKIYPNPANEVVNIIFDKKLTQKVNIRLVQMNGLTVNSTEIRQSISEVKLNVSHLSPGVYVLVAQSKDFTITRKVVVIH